MELREAIFARTSVRAFADEPVSDETVVTLLQAAMAAPSGGNQQPWHFYVVRDGKTKAELAAASPYAGFSAKAPVVIVPCFDTSNIRFEGCIPQDMSAAIENILLTAVDEGLGACWMGMAPERERMAAAKEILQLPENVECFALVAVGYPAKDPEPKGAGRYDAGRVTWI